MPLLRAEGRRLFFAHVPKTGGSSLEDYLAARFGPLAWLDREWEIRWLEGGCREAGLRVSPQHLAAEDIARLLPGPPDWSFALVRDPAARIVSEYRFQARAPRRRRRLAELGFSTWLRAVLALARREPTVFDNHIRPQTDLVPEGAEVFRLENGFAPLIARLDAVTETSAPELEVGHALRSDDIAPPALRGPDLALIAEAYAADYERFGYPRPDPSATPGDALAPLRGLAAEVMASAALPMWRSGRL
jgi:hypothetical protein